VRVVLGSLVSFCLKDYADSPAAKASTAENNQQLVSICLGGDISRAPFPPFSFKLQKLAEVRYFLSCGSSYQHYLKPLFLRSAGAS